MEENQTSTIGEVELSGEEKRQNVIRLAFGGSEERYREFVEEVRRSIPPGTGVVLRGSAVTGCRWKDQAPFDADGHGTSDLDLTLVGGDEVIGLYKVTGFFVPVVGNIVGGVGNFAQSLVFSPYSRSQESQADEVGQEMAAKAGWDPVGLGNFLATLGREEALLADGPRRPSFFDSHPATPDRVKHTTKHAKELKQATREPISPSHDAFLARLDGLVVGQRAANGIVQGQTYRHPDLNFFVQFPATWNVDNTPVQLASAPKEGGKAVVLRAVAEGNDPLDGARALEKASKSSLPKTQTTTVNGLPAARTQVGDSRLKVDLTWIAYGGMIYQIAGIAETRAYESVRPVFQTVVESFRPLSPEERKGIREKRLRLVKAQAGETVEELTARSGSAWKASQVIVANGFKGPEAHQEWQLIKIAVEEPYEGKPQR